MAWFKREKKPIEQTTPPEERRVRTEGHAPTLEQAKADFRTHWEAFKSATGPGQH